MQPEQAEADLDDLRWHWGEAYDITERAGMWQATRADGRGALIAFSAAALRALIVADYSHCPVPRS